METPVYLFTGFLEAGKTKFIEETLADPNFYQAGDRTLVILCEDGEVELDFSLFPSKDVFLEVISEKSRLNPDKLAALQRKHKATRIMLEYNGMWLLSDLFSALPEGWLIYQEMFFVDSTTFSVFNANMRNLVVDKLNTCELVVFNRCDGSTDKLLLHKIVRTTSRRCNIIYESTDGSFEYDEIEDPMPFDVNAEVIKIGDRDYALWYRDLSENMDTYDGKTVTFLGMVTRNEEIPDNAFVIGRPIMTCCADDIAFSGLLCYDGDSLEYKKGKWVRLKAKVEVKFCELYGKEGPVLSTVDIEPADPPSEPVATFY